MRRVHLSMNVRVNGDAMELPAGETIARLLERLGKGGAACAVEVNEELAPKATHSGRELTDGDVVEVVTLVGGG